MFVSLNLLLQNIANGLLIGCVYALVAMGLALQFGVMNVINFAHGEFVMLAMYITFFLSFSLGIPGELTLLFTFPIYFVFGYVVYKLVIDKVIDAPAVSQIGITIGLLILLQNLALAAWKAEPKAVQSTFLTGKINLGSVVVPVSRLVTAVVSVVVLFLLNWVLNKTYFGVSVRATSDDMRAAALMGVNVRRMYAVVFGLGCSIIAIAAAFIMTFQQVNPLAGLTWGLLSWVIVAMGGLGGVTGVLASGLILGVAEGLEITFWDPRASTAIIYLIFILVLWFKPKGLFGRR